MIPKYHTNDDDTGTVFRDVIFVMMLTFVVLFLAALIHINPEAKTDDEVTRPPGNVQVDITWPNGYKSDVDLWVKGPTDARPVGYSNRSGILFNLLRDDLGAVGDTTELNYENAYTHGVDDGEYIINVHMYSMRETTLVSVTVVVRYSVCADCRPEEVIVKIVDLTHNGHEITVVRFTIKDGVILPEKTNHIPIPLRDKMDNSRNEHGF